jgi:hypothetical protein
MIKVRMTDHIKQLSAKYNSDKKVALTPAAHTVKLTVESQQDTRYPYQSLIGSLMYIASGRYDIKWSVNHLARFNHGYGVKHYEAAVRVVKYLRRTQG